MPSLYKHGKINELEKYLGELYAPYKAGSVGGVAQALVAWHSGGTSVSGRRTFPVLRSTCS